MIRTRTHTAGKRQPRSLSEAGLDGTPIASRTRRAPGVPLERVRLRDLMTGDSGREPGRLITVRVPQNVLRDVRKVAERYGSTYADTVIALLNEGLDAARRRRLL